MALNKDKLKAQMQAKSPTQTAPSMDIPLTDITQDVSVKANDRTVEQPNGLTPPPLKSAKKLKRAPEGVKNTTRYSFEITTELKDQLERAILDHQLNTGKKITTSAVIRNAIAKHLKAGKL
jgi:hypothetical protein